MITFLVVSSRKSVRKSIFNSGGLILLWLVRKMLLTVQAYAPFDVQLDDASCTHGSVAMTPLGKES